MDFTPEIEPSQIETFNDFAVGVNGRQIAVLFGVPSLMDKTTALRLAAWIVALADPGDEFFPAVLAAVRNT